jgi:hypothetical protein
MASTDEPVQAVRDEGPAEPPRAPIDGPGASKPIVATVNRWAAGSAAFALGLAAAAEGVLLFTHSSRSFESFVTPLVAAAFAGAVVLVFILRAEESRLARELRTARTGTGVLRALVARRRVAQPFIARFASTPLGTAAVLIADGDREGAMDLMARTPALMRGGRLEALRAIVEADLSRGNGAAGLARCVSDLRATPESDNREAELYRVHVLVKAILARGDAEAGFELASHLGDSPDNEARIYATWLRVWFDFDVEDDDGAGASADGGAGASGNASAWPALSEGELRMATLVARAHGAEDLVSKLALRVSAIARSEPEE